MKEIKTGKVLLIPDIHQNLAFADAALKEDFDHVVFMGDYFDCFERIDNQEYFSVRYVCDWINTKYKELGDKATWLVGNHDIAYLGTFRPKTYEIHRPQGFCLCSGWTKNKASTFNQYINPEWVNSLNLAVRAHDYVVSHAGFHYSQFQNALASVQANIDILIDEFEQNRFGFRDQAFHWITDCGPSRGGMADAGSPVWLDWDTEFVPIERLRQIVGHTNGSDVRFRGENICLDAYRTTYAVLDENDIQFKKWKEQITSS